MAGVSNEDDQSDIWDDELVIKAYENSIKLCKEDVAKRLANSTNSALTQERVVDTSAGERKLNWEPVSKTFKVGDFCRATYFEDGVIYEAEVISINEKTGRYVIKFLGYGNEQTVRATDLIASWGEDSRREQIEEAGQDSDETESSSSEMEATNYDRNILGQTAKKAKFQGYPESFFSGITIPPPPPMPPSLAEDGMDSDLAAMLMSWYMSGYYTGVYETTKKFKKNNRK